ncbi:MAG: bis(5'-nucleosyl)-tetraphosphatase (symmetrical) YqeK [Eubacteriales bacterium]|nr:bis(5'-nucleosyl)-tetraphosphatase (symmetrical) YqeK [Eubacteriales bacterium]
MDTEQIKECLLSQMSQKRFLHSQGVSSEAKKLARIYGADEEKAELAGLVHDCVKEMPYDEMIKKCQEYGITLDPVAAAEKKLIHAVLGAEWAKRELGVGDEGIYNAIRYHTTAKADMPLLTKVVYVADYIEPNRTYEGVEQLRRLAYSDLDGASLVALDYTINKLVASHRMLHPDTVNARNFLLMNLAKPQYHVATV